MTTYGTVNFPSDDEVEYDDTDNDTAIVIYPYRALNPDEVCNFYLQLLLRIDPS